MPISHLKQNNSTVQIVITQDTIQEFCNELRKIINLLRWQYDLKSFSLADSKQPYQKTYEKWILEEEKILVIKFEHSLSIKEIAAILARQPGAINSRLRKLGLK